MNSQQRVIEASLLPLRGVVIKGKYRMCVSDPVEAFFRALTGGRVEGEWEGGEQAAKALKEVPNGSRKRKRSHLFSLIPFQWTAEIDCVSVKAVKAGGGWGPPDG